MEQGSRESLPLLKIFKANLVGRSSVVSLVLPWRYDGGCRGCVARPVDVGIIAEVDIL